MTRDRKKHQEYKNFLIGEIMTLDSELSFEKLSKLRETTLEKIYDCFGQPEMEEILKELK